MEAMSSAGPTAYPPRVVDHQLAEPSRIFDARRPAMAMTEAAEAASPSTTTCTAPFAGSWSFQRNAW
jgi:hypothetical protein